jgi:hypothetical protein
MNIDIFSNTSDDSFLVKTRYAPYDNAIILNSVKIKATFLMFLMFLMFLISLICLNAVNSIKQDNKMYIIIKNYLYII